MRQIRPYRTREGLAKAIDNGGRWYNVLTRAADNVVSASELKTAASGGDPLLFLEMAMWKLPVIDQNAITGLLDPELGRRYRERETRLLKPSECASLLEKGLRVVMEGYPRRLKDDSRFSGFMMMPLQVGTVTSMMMIPMTDQFSVWEVFEAPAMTGEPAIVITPRKRPSFAGGVRIGGCTEKYDTSEDEASEKRFCIRSMYYTPLDD